MKEVLFICYGNVGRSQMAEGFYNNTHGEGQAVSAGIQNLSELTQYHGHPAKEIISAMEERGIDVSKQEIKQITEDMLLDLQKIVILCNPSLCPPYIFSSGIDILIREVEDPYNADDNTTRSVRNQIEKIIQDLTNE